MVYLIIGPFIDPAEAASITVKKTKKYLSKSSASKSRDKCIDRGLPNEPAAAFLFSADQPLTAPAFQSVGAEAVAIGGF
jgi:hypothetical protein